MKIKKTVKLTQKLILVISVISFTYLFNRFSIYYIDRPIDIENAYLRSGYLLVDRMYQNGRELKNGDFVIYDDPSKLGFISAIFQDEQNNTQYLIYCVKNQESIFVQQKYIGARVLMNILQK